MSFMHDIPWSSIYAAAALLLQVLLVVGVCLRVILTRHPPGSSFAWILLVTALPFIGFILYVTIGEVPIGRWRARKIRKALEKRSAYGPVDGTRPSASAGIRESRRGLVRLAEKLGGYALTSGSTLELISDTGTALRRLAADIDAAQESVSLEFYIWNAGGLADTVAEALIRAARRGVRCRVLVDDIGSRDFIKSGWPKRWQQEGILFAAALPVRLPFHYHGRADLRMHRKIAVVDGVTGYTGSLNLIDPPFFPKSRYCGCFVDAMARVDGPAAGELQRIFSLDWALLRSEDSADDHRAEPIPATTPTGSADVVVIQSGPASPTDANLNLVIEAAGRANRELLITTPYFVPTEALAIALQNAARRGVDVRLCLPKKSDSRLVDWAGRRYFDDLLDAGVTILFFSGGLLHTKAITVDGEFTVFGSVNMDQRSLHLNFEIMLLVFDDPFVRSVCQLQKSYEGQSVQVETGRWRRRGMTERLREGACFLLSPLL